MATFQSFFQSMEQVVVRRGQIRRIGWVIKTLEVQVGQFLLGCKCPVSRGIVVQEQDPLRDIPAAFLLQNVLQLHQQRQVILRVDSLALWKIINEEDAVCTGWFHYVNHCSLVRKSSRTQPPRSPDLTAMDFSSEGWLKACLCPSIVDIRLARTTNRKSLCKGLPRYSQTRQASTYKRNKKGSSRNHCCSEKAICITYLCNKCYIFQECL